MKCVLRTSVAVVVFIAGAAVASAQTNSANPSAQGAGATSGAGQSIERGRTGPGHSGVDKKAGREGRSASEPREQGVRGQSLGEEPQGGGVKSGVNAREGRSTMEEKRQGQKGANAPSEARKERGLKSEGSEGRSASERRNEHGKGLRGDERSERNQGIHREDRGATERERSEGRSVTQQRQQENQRIREEGGGVRERGAQSRGGVESEGRSSFGVTNDQRVQIREHILKGRVARVDHVDFDVRVGTVVPRGVVRIAPLPPAVVRIMPRFRGYDFFVVGDEIVIVDPRNYQIVAVLPA